MARANTIVACIVIGAGLAGAAAAAEHVVVGKRTYMSSYPFYGC
jgi:monoamine oxidase